MDELRSASILVCWDAGKRLAIVSYEAEIRATAKDVKPVAEALKHWIGTKGETFFLLNDCARLAHMDTECRAIWWALFRPHRDHSWYALYHVRPFVKVIVEMYRVATGLRIAVFDNEEDARRWLREKGAST